MALALRNSYSTPKHYPSLAQPQQTGVSVVAGDLIIVAWRADAQNSVTCADNAAGGSNTYNEIGSGQYFSTASCDMHVFYAIAKATETLTITITTAAAAYSVITVHVVSGALADLANVLDTHAFSTHATNTQLSTATINTTNANDYIFVWWAQDSQNNISIDEGNGLYTKRQENTDYYIGGPSSSFDRIVSSRGAYSQNVNLTATAPEVSIIAAFKSNLPDITSFTSTPVKMQNGESATLDWVIQRADSVSIDQGIGTVTGSSRSVSPTASTTYTITATNTFGSVQANVTVGIIATMVQLNAFQNNAFQIISGVQYNATQMFMMF